MMFQFELHFIDKEIGFLITVPRPKPAGGGGSTPYNGLYGEARLKGVPYQASGL